MGLRLAISSGPERDQDIIGQGKISWKSAVGLISGGISSVRTPGRTCWKVFPRTRPRMVTTCPNCQFQEACEGRRITVRFAPGTLDKQYKH